jgi:hypothetical protein
VPDKPSQDAETLAERLEQWARGLWRSNLDDADAGWVPPPAAPGGERRGDRAREHEAGARSVVTGRQPAAQARARPFDTGPT